jgi:hypothetical protein
MTAKQDAAPATVETENSYVQCEWIVQSYYHKKQCNRDAPENIWGLSLCWQHGDAAFKHVVDGIERGHYGIRPIEEMAQAVLSSKHFNPNGNSQRDPHVATFVEEQIISYLQALINQQDVSAASLSNRAQWWNVESKYQINNLIDCLVQKRLEQSFGKGA